MTVLDEAIELFMAGRLEEARRACRKALRERPDLAEGHMLLAEIQRRSGDEARARESTARVLRLRPGWSEAHIHVAIADLLADFGRHDEAASGYRRALELEPGLSDARYNLAAALFAAGRVPDSITELRSLLEREPGAADAREQLVRRLKDLRRFGELEPVCRDGMKLHPQSPLYPNALGIALWWSGKHDDAIAAFRISAERAGQPESDAYQDARLAEASSLLALGRYAEGWQAYRWRHPRAALRKAHPELVSDPGEVAALREPKRIRVLSEQGFGDDLFFLRFAVALRRRGHRLGMVCDAKLAAVLAGMPELFDSVNDAGSEADFTLCSGDLPLASAQSFAPPLALPVDAARRSAFEARLRRFGPPPYVGVTWRAGLFADEPKPQRGAYLIKEAPLEALAETLRPIDARVVVLQRRPVAAELARFAGALGREVLDLSQVNDQLEDALAVLSLLDEYVGVSNTNMHLRAGLRGKSARVLLRMPAEWRWALDGPLSPWFPDFRLYRRSPDGDWSPALAELQEGLDAAMQQDTVGNPQRR